MAKRRLSSTSTYQARDRLRKDLKRIQRRASPATKENLKTARLLQAETRRLLKEYEKERKRGAKANRRLLNSLLYRRYRRMSAIEKLFGIYRPRSSRLTASRKASIRRGWARVEKFLARAAKKKTNRKRSAKRRARPISNRKLQFALRSIRQKKSIRETASEIGVPPNRLLQQLKAKGALRKRGNRWVFSEKLSRRMLIYSDGKALSVVVGTRQDAKIASAYNNAVKAFKDTRDPAYLEVFRNGAVTDVNGVVYPLEVDPNVVLRLSFTGDQSFESIYRYVLP